ncbi:hypothetical protein DRP77_01520 [Candidatus Poribacteria bacterium]|nr:MAG: hypothetical protein DRP77_01520 [Candidatus Poribacteria bacterium]
MLLIPALLMLPLVLPIGAAKDWEFVDIQPYATSKVDGDVQWWTGDPGGSILRELPIGQVAEMEGPDGKVPYKIEEGCIVLFGTNAPKWPKEVKGIKVNAKARFIYFLHATGWEFVGGPSYKFVMNYEDGTSEELLMETHFNSDDWCHDGSQLQDENSVWAWRVQGGPPCDHSGLITTKWENPHPDKVITSIDAISLGTSAVPLIVAITLRDVTAAVDPSDRLAVIWGGIKRGIIGRR